MKGVERTFNSYAELQDHLYKDHDVHKDPAMEFFNKYKTQGSTASPMPPNSLKGRASRVA